MSTNPPKTIPTTAPAADVLPADRNIPATSELAPETKSPNPPKTEVVLITTPVTTAATVAVPVELSRRDALIAKKRKAGLPLDQATRVADDQIAHEKRLIAAAQGKGKKLPTASQPVRTN